VQLGEFSHTAIVPLRPGAVVRGGGAAATIVDAAAADFGLLGELAAADSASVAALSIVGGAGVRNDAGSLLLDGLALSNFERGVEIRAGSVQLTRCLLAVGDSAIVQRGGSLLLDRCTLVDVTVGVAAESSGVALSLQRSLFAYHDVSFLQLSPSANPTLAIACNDFHAAPLPFVGLASPIGVDGNVDLPIYFCARFAGDYRLPQDAAQLDLAGCGGLGAFAAGCTEPVAVGDTPTPALRLQVVPNPFNPRTQIRLLLPSASAVEWAIFDARGRLVQHRPRRLEPAGELHWIWDGTDLSGRSVASGVYRLRLQAGARTLRSSLVLIR
jgi:hypothetical protein